MDIVRTGKSIMDLSQSQILAENITTTWCRGPRRFRNQGRLKKMAALERMTSYNWPRPAWLQIINGVLNKTGIKGSIHGSAATY
jgi:hypothetical protein